MSYSALIVDDEYPARATLHRILSDYLPQITAIHEADSVAQALDVLAANAIEIVFLDVHMPNANGFELIKYLSKKEQHVIFVTAFSNYTYEAIKASAVDYLMKPIMIDELLEAATKTFQQIELLRAARSSTDNSRLLRLLEYLDPAQPKTIHINHSNGFEVINLDNVLYLEASKSYTIFHLLDEKQVVASRNMAYFEQQLDESQFFRIHKSFLINWNYLKGYSAHDGHHVFIKGGKQLPVSKRKLNDFLKLSKV